MTQQDEGGALDLFGAPSNGNEPPMPAPLETRASMPYAIAQHAPSAPGSPTSRAAARRLDALKRTQSAQARVLHAINAAANKGATRAELAGITGLRLSTVCSSVRRLYQMGYVGSNPGMTRVDRSSGMNVEVLFNERYVSRWRNADGAMIPRRQRTTLDDEPCSLAVDDDAESSS